MPFFKPFALQLFPPFFRSISTLFQPGRPSAHVNTTLGVKMVAFLSVKNLALFLCAGLLGSMGTCATAFWGMGDLGLLNWCDAGEAAAANAIRHIWRFWFLDKILGE